MTPFPRYSLPLLAGACLLASLSACAPTPAADPSAGVVTRSLGARSGPQLEGTVRVPPSLLGSGSREDTLPLSDAQVSLLDPQDVLFRTDAGKMVSVTTDKNGAFRFVNHVPKDVPVIVSAALQGNRRLVGLVVPVDGVQTLELSIASTYVTEYLRLWAGRQGKSMADYDASRLTLLFTATQKALAAGQLPVPDLVIGRTGEMNRAYAIAIGNNLEGLGDGWAKLLKRRVLAVETVVGTGEAGSGGDGKKALEANLYQPRQMVVDGEGHMYIADEGNHRIRKVAGGTGVITTLTGTGAPGFSGDGGPAEEAQLEGPTSVVVDAAGNVYIGDSGNARVRKIHGITGIISTVVGNPQPKDEGGWVVGHDGDGGRATEGLISAVRGLTLDVMGNVYLADSQSAGFIYHTVRKLDVRSGLLSTVAGVPRTAGGFFGEGTSATSARLNSPGQLAVDPQGRLLIADTENHCIRRVDFGFGTIETVVGVGGQAGEDADGLAADKTKITRPIGVIAASDGTIYFSERDRVRVVLPGGTLRTIAGGGTDTGDGESLSVKLNGPHGLFVEPDGDVLVAETRGNRIRRLVTRFGL